MTNAMTNKSYSELNRYHTFDDRFNYLKLNGYVGEETFGTRRYMNQKFYTSLEWKRFKRSIIIRDNGCDLGLPGYEISGSIYIHHINPISIDDIVYFNYDKLLNPDNAISTSFDTHQAIHYGRELITADVCAERFPNDTKLW